jgi:5'(3')-deoxyribonucleotidase
MKKKIVYIDMDDTIADFFKAAYDIGPNGIWIDESRMYIDGFFENLEPIAGALEGVRRLLRKPEYDVWICTQPLAESAASYIEKVRWINKWFPELNGKIVMTQHKGLCLGEYLIDDNPGKWKEKFEKNEGQTFIEFRVVRSTNMEERDRVHRAQWELITKELL